MKIVKVTRYGGRFVTIGYVKNDKIHAYCDDGPSWKSLLTYQWHLNDSIFAVTSLILKRE